MNCMSGLAGTGILCAAVLVALAGGAAAQVALRPLEVESFFIEPNKPARLRWRATGVKPGRQIEYTVRNYSGGHVADGRAAVGDDGTVEVTLTLPRGF